MTGVSEHTLKEFVDTCRETGRRGLVRCSSGNMSCRLDEQRFLATASRSWMESLSEDEVAVCRIADGEVIEGPKPTVEVEFHAGILRTRPDINVVLHFQTTYATALACRATENINYFVIPEIPFYIGPVAGVPYLTPGSAKLAEAVTEAMRDHDMAVMANHGQVTVAKDYACAIQNAEFFELACQIIVLNGNAIAPLPESATKHLAESRQA